MTVDEFRAAMPAFDTSGDPDSGLFGDDAITYWLTIASKQINHDRFAADGDETVYNLATCQFVAHNLAFEAFSQKSTSAGAIPGLASGLLAAKAAGDVSVTYDTGSVLEMGAGHWNYTVYGKRFFQLMMMMGAGPLQIGPSGCLPENSGPAWPGPFVKPTPETPF